MRTGTKLRACAGCGCEFVPVKQQRYCTGQCYRKDAFRRAAESSAAQQANVLTGQDAGIGTGFCLSCGKPLTGERYKGRELKLCCSWCYEGVMSDVLGTLTRGMAKL
jgi:hypothetical protein